jgi:hypothetical protein
MKKALAVLGLLLGMAALSHAAIPMETYYGGQPPLSNKSVVISTFSSGGGTISMNVAPGTFNNGGTAQNCRLCFTNFFVQITSATTVNILDAGTTDYVIYGASLGTAATNALTINRDHNGPICFGTGDTAYINMSGGGVFGESITAEGYTNCGGTNNAGPMY